MVRRHRRLVRLYTPGSCSHGEQPGQVEDNHWPQRPTGVISSQKKKKKNTLRHCNNGKAPRAAVRVIRLKLFHGDRDEFSLKHNITPTDYCSRHQLVRHKQTIRKQTIWYAIDRLLNDKRVGKRRFYLVKWQDSMATSPRSQSRKEM